MVGLSPIERTKGRESFDMYCFLLWPFIESYWLTAVSLFALTPPLPKPSEVVESGNGKLTVSWVAERDWHKRAQLFGKSLFYQVRFYLSVNDLRADVMSL